MLLGIVVLLSVGSCLFIYIGASGIKKMGLVWLMLFSFVAFIAISTPPVIIYTTLEKSGLTKIEDLPSIVLQLQGQAPTVRKGNIATLENTAPTDGRLYFVPVDQLNIEAGSFVRKEKGPGKSWQLVLADQEIKSSDPNE